MKIEYKESELLQLNEQNDTKLFGIHFTEMVYIEIGSFMIGDNKSIFDNEKESLIAFDRGYFIGKYPVTQALYEHITGHNPADFKGKNRPVENVSWDDIARGEACFLNLLNKKIQEDYPSLKGFFALPSKAQWEYAARGGKFWDKPKLHYAGSNAIEDVAWYDENANLETMPVGLKQPNRLGLYDMAGNVWEWCKDSYVNSYNKIPINGEAYQKIGSGRVLRGGFWNGEAVYCRSTFRSRYNPVNRYPFFGFRLVFL